jgi:hypothetical protein
MQLLTAGKHVTLNSMWLMTFRESKCVLRWKRTSEDEIFLFTSQQVVHAITSSLKKKKKLNGSKIS